jgi:hypothetical protein
MDTWVKLRFSNTGCVFNHVLCIYSLYQINIVLFEILDPRNLSSVQLATRQGDQPGPNRFTKPVWHQYNKHFTAMAPAATVHTVPALAPHLRSSTPSSPHTRVSLFYSINQFIAVNIYKYSLICCLETLSTSQTISTPPTQYSAPNAVYCSTKGCTVQLRY